MCDFKDKEAIELAQRLQDLEIVVYKDNFGVIKQDSSYYFANFSDNFIVNLKTKIHGEKEDIFRLFEYFNKTGRLDLKLVKKDFKIKKRKKVKRLEYKPFIMDKEVFDSMVIS